MRRNLLIYLFIFLSGCSVYKNSGRDQFEDRAPNSVNQLSTMAEGLCWNQPAEEPLWNLDLKNSDQNQLIVKRISETEIQVCSGTAE